MFGLWCLVYLSLGIKTKLKFENEKRKTENENPKMEAKIKNVFSFCHFAKYGVSGVLFVVLSVRCTRLALCGVSCRNILYSVSYFFVVFIILYFLASSRALKKFFS